MAKTIIDELLDFKRAAADLDSQSEIERCMTIGKLSNVLSVIPQNVRNAIESDMYEILNEINTGEYSLISEKVKSVVADILEAIPEGSRNKKTGGILSRLF